MNACFRRASRALALLRVGTVAVLLAGAACSAHPSQAPATITTTPTVDEAPAFQPQWSGIYAHLYPDCTGIFTVPKSLADNHVHSLITLTPNGKLARVPYDEATMRRITRTFDDDVRGNEENTIGACTKEATR